MLDPRSIFAHSNFRLRFRNQAPHSWMKPTKAINKFFSSLFEPRKDSGNFAPKIFVIPAGGNHVRPKKKCIPQNGLEFRFAPSEFPFSRQNFWKEGQIAEKIQTICHREIAWMARCLELAPTSGWHHFVRRTTLTGKGPRTKTPVMKLIIKGPRRRRIIQCSSCRRLVQFLLWKKNEIGSEKQVTSKCPILGYFRADFGSDDAFGKGPGHSSKL